jgi:DnaK suppressor protein
MLRPIDEDAMVFVSDGDAGVGAVREVMPGGRPELVVYVENAGDFIVPLSAVSDVHAGKVVVDCRQLSPSMRTAIGHAHEEEDPSVIGTDSTFAGEEEENAGLGILFVEQQRARLESLRDQLASRQPSMAAQRDKTIEFEEQAQESAAQEPVEILRGIDHRRIAQIERALEKIKEGTYGLSDQSGARIPRVRLEATPEATLTVQEEHGWESATSERTSSPNT